MSNRISWTWRHAFARSELPSTTKLVLHTIGLFMDETGGGSYPTTKQISALSTLSERAVISHIRAAIEQGWLRSKVHGFKGQKWKNHEYEAYWPAEIGDGKGTERHSKKGPKALNVVPEGTEPDDRKALNEVQSIVPSKASITEKEKNTKKEKTPLEELTAVLDSSLAAEVIAHRKGMKKPLTAFAARKLASQFEKTGNASAAAETMIVNGWQGFNPDWVKNQKTKQTIYDYEMSRIPEVG